MQKRAQPTLIFALAAMLTVLGSACGQPPSTAAIPAASSAGAYAPGLGEIMTLQQMRHTKQLPDPRTQIDKL